MTRPASNPIERVTYATAGVGRIPAVVRTADSDRTPRASSRSIHSPDSRVSRPTRNRERAIGAHGPYQRGAQPRDSLVIEGKFARRPADAVGAKKSL